MSEDLTQKLPTNGNDNEILTAIKDLDTKVTKIDTRLETLEQKFDDLEQKVDTRLHDTRPIWHKVVADIAELQSGQTRLEEGQKRLQEGQEAMREDLSVLSTTMRNVNRDQLVANDVVRRMQLDFLSVNECINKLMAIRNQQNSST